MFQTTNQELSKTVKLGGNMFSDKPKKTCWRLRLVSPSTIFSYNIIKYHPISPEKKKKKTSCPFMMKTYQCTIHQKSSYIIKYHQISPRICPFMVTSPFLVKTWP